MKTAILLSGGNGSRIGGPIPKQYIKVNGQRIIDYSLEVFGFCKAIDSFCIVADGKWQKIIIDEMEDDQKAKFIGFASPGETRQLSIVNGLNFIKDYYDNLSDDDIVLVHDAARPNITSDMIIGYVDAMKGHDGVLPVLPMKDTVYMSKDGKSITSLVDRNTIFAGQAPEVFLFNKYLAANEALLPDKIKSIHGSSEPAAMAGMDIVLVEGDEENIKITTMDDLHGFIG